MSLASYQLLHSAINFLFASAKVLHSAAKSKGNGEKNLNKAIFDALMELLSLFAWLKQKKKLLLHITNSACNLLLPKRN